MTRATLIVAGLALLTGGCAATKVPLDPAVDKMSDMAFLARLPNRPLVAVDEAARAVLIVADGECDAQTADARQEAVIARGIVRPAWKLAPDDALDRGTLAYMIARVCVIDGGINCRTFGEAGIGDRRYALREMVYQKLMTDGPVYGLVTGGEMTAVLTKADAYMEKRGLYEVDKPVELGDQPPAQR